MHLSAAIPGVTLGRYTGMKQRLLTLVTNIKLVIGAIDCICTFITGTLGKDPRDL